jgi:hypothetical protein
LGGEVDGSHEYEDLQDFASAGEGQGTSLTFLRLRGSVSL